MKRKLIAYSTIMVLLFSLSIANVGAHPVTVDGRIGDWFSTASGSNIIFNHGYVARNGSQQGEFIWRDAEDDHRVITSTTTVTDVVDLTWFRVTADATNLYLFLRVKDNPVPNPPSLPYPAGEIPEFQVAIDRSSGGNTALVGEPNTTVATNAAWEFLVRTNFRNNPDNPPRLHTTPTGQGTATGTGSLKKASDDLAELSIPWSQIGGFPSTLTNNRLRFSVAVFYSDHLAPQDGQASTVMDTLNPTQGTLTDLGDGTLNYYVDVLFSSSGEAIAPLQITEFEANPSDGNDWIEIYNPNSFTVPLEQYKIGDAASRNPTTTEGMFKFPNNSSIAAGEFAIVAKDRTAFNNLYFGGITPANVKIYDPLGSTSAAFRLTQYTAWANGTSIDLQQNPGALTNFSEQVVLLDDRDTIVDMATYSTNGAIFFAHTPIPVAGSVPQNISYERCPNTLDTNNNANDFQVRDAAALPTPLPPTPGLVCPPPLFPDLKVDKTGPAEVVPDNTTIYTYTITFDNLGTANMTNVVVRDTLPTGMTLEGTPVSTPAADNFTNTNGVLEWTYNTSIIIGAHGIITVTTKLGSGNDILAGAPLTNTVQISATESEQITENNNATSVATVIRPDLEIDKSGPSTVRPGETFTYTISYSNNGEADATNVTITDALPASLSFELQSAPAGVTFGQSGSNLTWTIASLPAGDSGTIALQVRLNATTDGQVIRNTASISGTPSDPAGSTGNNTKESNPLAVNFFKIYTPLVTK